MKKFVVLAMTLVLLLGVFAGSFSVAAATQYTKNDVVKKLSESAVYKYVEGDLRNLSRSVNASQEQINALYGVAEKFVALNLKDKGASAHGYTNEEITQVLALVDEACDVMGYTFDFQLVKNSKHKGDFQFSVYNAKGKVVYAYDGDAVKKTGEDNVWLYVTVSLLGCALLAGAVFAAKSRKVRA